MSLVKLTYYIVNKHGLINSKLVKYNCHNNESIFCYFLLLTKKFIFIKFTKRY